MSHLSNGTGSSATNGTGAPQPGTPEALEADVARQREQLAATVEELQAKLDVKTRAQAKAAELKDRATTDTGKPRPQLLAVVALTVVLVGALAYRRRTR